MITAEQALKKLKNEQKIIIDKDSFNGLDHKYQALGKMLSEVGFYVNKDLPVFYQHFDKDYTFNPWITDQGKKLAKILFGEIRSPYIADIWSLINEVPYQQSYYRRSFRNAPSEEHLERKIRVLQHLVQSGTKQGFAFLSVAEQIQYNTYSNNAAHEFLFATFFDDQSLDLDELITDIINAEDDIGGVSRAFIKGLLLSKNERYWQQVGQLLLAAQRQEGLRQTILECLDETQIGAMQYMIQLILNHDLMRFSSVVRAVDTWFGFGWDAPKKSTIKRVLEISDQLLSDKAAIANALKSQDFLEVYVALWTMALENTDQANEAALDIVYHHENKMHKLLALFFMRETKRSHTSLIDYLQKNIGQDIELDYWMLLNAPKFELSEHMFNVIKKNADALPTKGKNFDSRVFSWRSYSITPDYFYLILIDKSTPDGLRLLADDISQIPSTARESYIRKIFPDHYSYGFYYQNRKKKKVAIETSQLSWKRAVAHQAITDRNVAVMATGVEVFKAMQMQEPELDIIENIMTRKNKSLRKELIPLLKKQPEQILKSRLKRLLAAKKIDQRLAGLEILSTLDEEQQYPDFVKAELETYQSRDKFSKNEQVFLDKMTKTDHEFNFSNGFGAINYDNLSPLVIPEKKFDGKKGLFKHFSKKTLHINNFVDEKKVVDQINKLIELIKEHKDYEYDYVNYNGHELTTLLSEHLYYTIDIKNASAEEKLHSLPLSELWIQWYNKCGLNDMELSSVIFYSNRYSYRHNSEALKEFLHNYIPNLTGMKLENNYGSSLNNAINTILTSLMEVHADMSALSKVKIDLFEDAIASFPDDLKNVNLDKTRWRYRDFFWFDALYDHAFLTAHIEPNSKKIWDLNRYLMAQSLGHPKQVTALKQVLESAPDNKDYIEGTSERQSIPLYHKGLITKDDLLLETLLSKRYRITLDCEHNQKSIRELAQLKPPFEIFKPLKKNLLSLELQRGDLETDASRYIRRFDRVVGTHYLFTTLERMGKSVFERGYAYDTTSKSSTFSFIIKNCYAKDSENYEDFAEQVKSSKISKKRLMEVACYATQWAEWIGRYLKIDLLPSAVWWFHAHSSEYMNAEKETIISRYSQVSMNDFNNGSLDIDWFYQVYKNLGKSNWKMLHDASKYISSGHATRQVKLYSQVLLKEVKITETLKKIKEKRDQIYVRALGLVPLSRSNAQADVLKRYHVLQEFLKDSKQFGAQRQESEKNAVNVGLENLARNAGYSDSTRLSWAMESQAAEQIMSENCVEIDQVVITLNVDDQGKAQLLVNKNGKSQKSIPVKLRKHKQVLKLKEHKSYLGKQHSRTRVSLEKAMLSQDAFTVNEMHQIMQHPVVKPMLEKLVLFCKEKNTCGFWHQGQLLDHQQQLHELGDDDLLLIAHPVHLFQCKQWSHYQKHSFDNALIQPFKQIFRELYLVTDDEKEGKHHSQRYQGHQIQPKKAAALLRSRGWTLNYEEGLQKVHHKHDLMASLYAMADWYSPSDVEAPTIEHVAFNSLKSYKALPLEEIDPVIFSEIMRDVDLVVSVAHVGGVDPEASHSSMEMRAVLAKESARLFKLDNVEVKKRHILIKGQLADYNIHLGSANVSRDGLALSIIPVHSQHRGRLFLPFVDDDPKSAEIISKMRLLAEDHKIQDPTVLAQINKNY